MRTWLLTNTTYGSWLPGDPRGSVGSVRDLRPGELPSEVRFEHDLPGEPYEDEMRGLELKSRSLLSGPPIFFDVAKADIVCNQFRETAQHRSWELLAIAIMYNHFHMVVLVPGDPSPKKVLADFKAYGSRALNERYGRPPSNTWWTTRGSKRKLKDEAEVNAAVKYVLDKQPNPLVVWRLNLHEASRER